MFGLFKKGDMDINISKVNYAPGEVIQGTVVMKLKKPTKAKELSISLIAERESVTMRDGKRRKTVTSIFNSKQRLDTEKEYASGELSYPFQLEVPASLAQQQSMPGGMVGDVLKAASALGMGGVIKWQLLAKLDIPMSGDVSKRLQIDIAQMPQNQQGQI